MNHDILTANVCTMGLNLAYAVAAMVIGLVAIKLVDRLIFPNVDFAAELKRGNIAVAIFVGTIVILLGMVLSSAVR